MEGLRADTGIDVRDVWVRFGVRDVLRGAGLVAAPGEAVGLIGPNGSGKTTFMRVLAGLVLPSSGTGVVCGVPLEDRRRWPRSGIMLETPPFVDERSGRWNLRLLASIDGSPAGSDDAALDALMQRVGLDPADRTPVAAYSQGMRKRLGLAQALMGDPPLLLLDEPMNGLDPEGMRIFRSVVREAAGRGTVVVVSSHLLAEVDKLCGDVYFMGGGALVPVDRSGGGSLEDRYIELVNA